MGELSVSRLANSHRGKRVRTSTHKKSARVEPVHFVYANHLQTTVSAATATGHEPAKTRHCNHAWSRNKMNESTNFAAWKPA